MRIRLLILCTLVGLTAAAPAAAKEISAMKVCGPSACTTLNDRATLEAIAESGGPPSSMPEPGPFYRVKFLVTEPGHGLVGGWDTWWAPRSAKMRGTDEGGTPFWFELAPAQQRYLANGAEALSPYPDPRFTKVQLGTKTVAGPASYRALFDPSLKPAQVTTGDWMAVTIDGPRNPWTDGVLVTYSPAKNVLWVGNSRVRLTDRMAANFESGRAVDAPGERRIPWRWLVLGAVLPLAAAAARGVRLLRRRRPQPRKRPTPA